jgi:hypothetical protein
MLHNVLFSTAVPLPPSDNSAMLNQSKRHRTMFTSISGDEAVQRFIMTALVIYASTAKLLTTTSGPST